MSRPMTRRARLLGGLGALSWSVVAAGCFLGGLHSLFFSLHGFFSSLFSGFHFGLSFFHGLLFSLHGFFLRFHGCLGLFHSLFSGFVRIIGHITFSLSFCKSLGHRFRGFIHFDFGFLHCLLGRFHRRLGGSHGIVLCFVVICQGRE